MTADEAKEKYIELQRDYGDVGWFVMLALLQTDPIEDASNTTGEPRK